MASIITKYQHYHRLGHLAAILIRDKSIHSSLQLEDNGAAVNDMPASINGAKSLVAINGSMIPLDFRNGLAYLNLRPCTDAKFEELPHVIMTRDVAWTQLRYDSIPSTDNSLFREQHNPDPLHPDFNLMGELQTG